MVSFDTNILVYAALSAPPRKNTLVYGVKETRAPHAARAPGLRRSGWARNALRLCNGLWRS
jgi:hypothetical protein